MKLRTPSFILCTGLLFLVPLAVHSSTSALNRDNLPQSIANVVLKSASQRTGLPKSELRITQSIKMEGSSSCLGLPSLPGEVCKEDLMPLWQVTVETGERRLVYRTNWQGSQIKLNEAASKLGDILLPDAVASAVLRQASLRTGLPTSQLRIEKFEPIQGSSSCLGFPPRLGFLCTADQARLWQVTVIREQQRLVYHTSWDGSKIMLNPNSV